MQKKDFGSLYHATVLCVDSYIRGVPQGRFYQAGSDSACEFHSLTHLLLQLEQMLDDTAGPQSYATLRSFGPNEVPAPLKLSGNFIQEGALATFAVRILFRQNASWQGSVRWVDGGKEQSFRSALELVFLLDSVLSEKAE